PHPQLQPSFIVVLSISPLLAHSCFRSAGYPCSLALLLTAVIHIQTRLSDITSNHSSLDHRPAGLPQLPSPSLLRPHRLPRPRRLLLASPVLRSILIPTATHMARAMAP